VGLDYEYGQLGTTHFALEDEQIISSLRNIEVVTPNNIDQLNSILEKSPARPRYLRLTKNNMLDCDLPPRWKINDKKYPHCGGSNEYFLNIENAN
jgi:transketolase C-terminal domain/subunit